MMKAPQRFRSRTKLFTRIPPGVNDLLFRTANGQPIFVPSASDALLEDLIATQEDPVWADLDAALSTICEDF